MLSEKFEYERFCLLAMINVRRAREYSSKLVEYLYRSEDDSSKTALQGVEVFPRQIPHYELINVGYMCLSGILDSSKFYEFKGISLEFDFLVDEMHFDYEKFDVAWLCRMNSGAIKVIAKKASVKNKIRMILLKELKKDNLKIAEQERLVEILVNFYE